MPEISTHALNQIERTLKQLSSGQAELGGKINQVSATQNATRSALVTLAAEFRTFQLASLRNQNIQQAKLNIVDVRQRLEQEFGHYADLRRQATGIVGAVDSGTVTENTIQSVAETSMVDAPKYWLAPALVGLAAWLRDDRPLADNALREALVRDNDKTALFYALILRRFGRSAAAARWIRQYVRAQNPSELSPEFVVILDAVACGALGQESRPLVMEHVTDWYERLTQDQDVVGAQVARWRELIASMRTPFDLKLDVLPEVCTVWTDLKAMYEGASVYEHADAFFHQLLDTPPVVDHDLRDRVDRILTNLVNEFDAEEAPLRREFDTYQAVIDHSGDLAAAGQASDAAKAARAQSVDFLTLLTNAAFYPKKAGTSAGTQQLAVALARDWIVAAGRELAEADQAARPKSVPIAMEGWTGNLADGVPLARMEDRLRRRIRERSEKEAAALTHGQATYVGYGFAVFFLLIALLTFVHTAVPAGCIFVLLALGSGYAGLLDSRKLPQRREEIREAGLRKAEASVRRLRQATAEYIDLIDEWKSAQEKAAPLADYLATLSPSAFLTRPADQIREVL